MEFLVNCMDYSFHDRTMAERSANHRCTFRSQDAGPGKVTAGKGRFDATRGLPQIDPMVLLDMYRVQSAKVSQWGADGFLSCPG